MWFRIKSILSNKAIMLKVAFTLFIFLLLRIASHIPVPLVNTHTIENIFSSSTGIFGILNNFSGRALERLSILSMGITPYITASIVVQLLAMVVPKLKEWQEKGEAGKYELNKVNRYLGIIVAFFQGLALILGFNTGYLNLFDPQFAGHSLLAIIFIAICITAGTALTIWFASLITEKGVGNGSSMLITAGIIIAIPTLITTIWDKYITNNTGAGDYVSFMAISVLYVLIILGVVFVESSKRNIPIQYANRSANLTGKVSTLPIKVNAANVMPVIFASTLMSVPLTFMSFVSHDTTQGVGYWIDQLFNFSKPIGYIIYVLLLVLFDFFYSFLTVNPNKVAENLSRQNAYIPGVKPGEETKNYVSKVLFKVTVVGTLYLVILASLPIFTALIFNLQGNEANAVRLGGTSILIVVGVAMETTRQIEAAASQKTYRGIF